MTEHSKDYIGPDPIKWIDRLIDVADGSQFTPEQIRLIVRRLQELQDEL